MEGMRRLRKIMGQSVRSYEAINRTWVIREEKSEFIKELRNENKISLATNTDILRALISLFSAVTPEA
jgi:predicted ATP-binding protein involved in virulence